jgi:hypothetical protein
MGRWELRVPATFKLVPCVGCELQTVQGTSFEPRGNVMSMPECVGAANEQPEPLATGIRTIR